MSKCKHERQDVTLFRTGHDLGYIRMQCTKCHYLDITEKTPMSKLKQFWGALKKVRD